ncbi:MAG: sigma-70 family RNA polymerase sigma factor [Thermomicrobiales bacterium]|nr:sigma-70 family RNA polymerase sigma factor [Thermomicrobiales bacterium]
MIGASHVRQLELMQERNDDERKDEAAQVELARRNPQAFAPLYTRYYGPVYRFCYRRLRHTEAALDATSQVFLKAIGGLSGFRGGSFPGWLFTIARNVVIDIQRQPGPHSDLPDDWDLPDHLPTPELQTIIDDDRRLLWRLLDELTPEQRDVVELRMAGFTGQEIADQLGRSLPAIKSLQWRAFARLRVLLDEFSPPDPCHDDEVQP